MKINKDCVSLFRTYSGELKCSVNALLERYGCDDCIHYDKGLYETYGSGTGVLFGIPANLKHAVRAIVKVILKSLLE